MTRVDETYIIEHLSQALEKDYIRPVFQPVFRSVTGKIVCSEALARWYDPDLGILSPADFIPALEKNGLIVDLDMHILRKTCAFYKELINRGTPIHSFSVNLSRYDFKDEDLYSKVKGILSGYDVPHEAINLEIIESLMLEDIDSFQKVFQKFSGDGFSVWIDDFGSGYSSLNVLQNYDFDVMKFDMMFLRNFSPKGKQMLASLINMGKSLGIHTLAEGVETKEQQEFLLAAGCEAQQGYLYSKPVSESDLISLIDTNPEILETLENKQYWNRIGHFNFLSANPLDEIHYDDEPEEVTEVQGVVMGLPIALLECEQDRIKYVYASEDFLKCSRDIGFESLEEMEESINNRRSDQYLMIKKMISDAIATGEVKRVEYVNNDVFYRLSSRLVARKKDRAMLALRMSTFDTEREVETAREMLNYGNALFSTYELVVLLYPDENLANRIYSARNLPTYDREATLNRTVQRFVEAQVDPIDQKRYLEFLNFDDLEKRISETPLGIIQGMFRLNWGQETSAWHTVRLTRLPSSTEKTFILTIQTIHGNGMHILDLSVKEHPELF